MTAPARLSTLRTALHRPIHPDPTMRIVSSLEPAAAPTAALSHAAETRSLRLEAHGGPHTRPLPQVDTSYERREQLERELDRVQHSLLAERTTYGQQLNWLMLSQALLLNAFLFVLILGWTTPLPAKRLLLAGIAVFAAVVAVLIVLALRGTRDAVISLHQHRKSLEGALQKDFGREPVFATRGLVTRGLASAANGLLPITFVAGWVALTIYTLAAPLGASSESTASAAPATARPATRSQARPTAAAPASASMPATAAAASAPPTAPAESLQAETEPVAAAQRTGGFKW
jgi:hypothetical protein